ncbi:L-glutamate gamma-semialdehyde dehydrogenase [Planctomycetota bacterium]
MVNEFKNEPFTDFSKPENRKAFEAALEKIRGEFDRESPLVIGGKEVKTNDKIRSINPADKNQVVHTSQKAGADMVEPAIAAAQAAFETWRYTPAEERAGFCFKAAKIMRERKHEFSAMMVWETSKNWAEADGDTAEAIDFLEFYGREAIRYGQKQEVTPYPGEEPSLSWIPLGVGAVIPPWNFPLAILVGMASAAFVSGNTVILKPSSDATGTGWKFAQLMQEVGLPDGVLNFCPGAGATFGDKLVQHPQTRFITFTGSKEVGLRIVEQAAISRPGQIWIKRVVAEMGGKDTIVVAGDGDLDAAAEGITAAAFGYQGQKCSACSRAIVDEKVYDTVVQKVIEHTKKLTVGQPDEYGTYMGAVINKAAFDSISEYIEIGKKEGELVCGGETMSDKGFHIQPTIFSNIHEDARISLEEIFGPVLAFIKCKDYEDGLRIANNTEYGLTGAVYSRSEENLALARERFHVGNLYLNRKCTGALVGVHPFGGFNMSGTDSKAGGRHYLAQFSQLKSVSRKI